MGSDCSFKLFNQDNNAYTGYSANFPYILMPNIDGSTSNCVLELTEEGEIIIYD